ncbi:MAG: hypothetical protein Q7S66_02715 [bacterium]|nr:hypothetical protein [bacterium]
MRDKSFRFSLLIVGVLFLLGAGCAGRNAPQPPPAIEVLNVTPSVSTPAQMSTPLMTGQITVK